MIRSYAQTFAAAAVLTAILFSAAPTHAARRTFTGEVGDAMCGRKHMEGSTAAECSRSCVAHGSKYALIVGDKIYTLDTEDKTALATLDKQGGKTAVVTGTLNGETIEVISVTAK